MRERPEYDPRKRRRILPCGARGDNQLGLNPGQRGILRFHCDWCRRAETWGPVSRRNRPAGLHLFRRRLRRKHGAKTPVYPKRTKRVIKWEERRWAGNWVCASCAANLRGVAPGVARAILAKHARCFLPRVGDAGETD